MLESNMLCSGSQYGENPIIDLGEIQILYISLWGAWGKEDYYFKVSGKGQMIGFIKQYSLTKEP